MDITIKIQTNGRIMRISDPDSDFYLMVRPPEGEDTFSDKLIGEHITLYLDWHRRFLEESVDRESQPL